MNGIFNDLNQGNDQIVLAVPEEGGKVMRANRPDLLPDGIVVPFDLNAEFKVLTFKGRTFLASIAPTDGYQGFFGLPWFGMAMIDFDTVFRKELNETGLEEEVTRKRKNFSDIYTTAVRAPHEERRCVGVIQIVFDAEPQFRSRRLCQ